MENIEELWDKSEQSSINESKTPLSQHFDNLRSSIILNLFNRKSLKKNKIY